MLPNNTYFEKPCRIRTLDYADCKTKASLFWDRTLFLNFNERLRKKASCSFLLVKKDSGKPEKILHSTTENKAGHDRQEASQLMRPASLQPAVSSPTGSPGIKKSNRKSIRHITKADIQGIHPLWGLPLLIFVWSPFLILSCYKPCKD